MSFETNPIDETPPNKPEYEKWERKQKMVRTCERIMKDMDEDSAMLDGQPFSGRTMGRQFGRNMAAIYALAEICKSILDE